MALVQEDAGRIIAEGVDIVMGYKRNPMTPKYVTRGPIPRIPIIRDDEMFQMYLAGLVAVSVRQQEWGRQRFYYPCLAVPHITKTKAWQAMEGSLLKYEVEPILTYENEIHLFEGQDWMLCVLRIALL
jgi:hypothetical protein